MADKANSLTDFFNADDTDWSFGDENSTDTLVNDKEAKVVSSVKGATKDNPLGDEDEDESVANLDNLPKEIKKTPEVVTKTKPKEIVKSKEAELLSKSQEDDKKIKGKDDDDDEEEEIDLSFDDKDDKEKDNKESKDKKQQEQGNEDEETDEQKWMNLAKEHKDKGVFQNVEIPAGEELTEDQFFELHDAEIEARAGEIVEGLVKDMDDDGKNFVRFKKNGGKTGDFVKVFVTDVLNLKSFNEEKKDHIDKVIDYYIRNYEDHDDNEEIEDRKKFIEDSGKSKAYAAKWYTKVKADEEAAQTKLLEDQQKASKKNEENQNNFVVSLKKVLETSDSIGDYKLTKTEIKELAPYITRATIKVKANTYVPELIAEVDRILAGKTKEDKQQLILLAKIIRDQFKIPEGIKTKAATEVATRVRSGLIKQRQGISPRGTGSYGSKSLADINFDN